MILPSLRRRRWFLVSLALLALSTAGYVRYARDNPNPHGGSATGIVYGIVGVLLILLLLAFGIRKRAYRSALGTLDGWLQAHVYLGLASVFVVLFHTGFRFQDQIATASFLVLLAVVSSGIVGAAFYTGLPRRLTAVGGNLTAEEISAELNRLAAMMARLASGSSPAFRKIHQQLQSRARPGRLAGWRLLVSGRERSESGDRWEPLLALVGDDERETLRKLLVLSRQHRELHQRLRRQQRYKNLLEAWLYLHLPLSILLIVLVAVHVVAALYFRGL
ncbi:MAG: hypothetical protein V3T72_17290 [Thermoanaerobaculia bacterium]